MNSATERQEIGAVIYGWTPPIAVEFFDPNMDFEFPPPSGDVASPNVYITWDVTYFAMERITFSGTVHVRGEVNIWIWVERDGGDKAWRELFDSLSAEFAAATPAEGLTFWEAEAGDAVSDGFYYGRDIRVPFDRFEER